MTFAKRYYKHFVRGKLAFLSRLCSRWGCRVWTETCVCLGSNARWPTCDLLGCRVWGFRFGVWDLGFMVYSSWLRVQGLRFRIQALGSRG